MVIAWKVFEDDELLYEGVFATELLRGDGDAMADGEVSTRGAQLTPLVRDKARALVQQQQQQQDESKHDPLLAEFPIEREALSIDRADPRVKSTDGSASSEWMCRLELRQRAPPLQEPRASAKSWFAMKIEMASELRLRGNEAFKIEKYRAAIRSYKKALQWLECPADCVYDTEEAAAVKPITLACHTNLATSYWKLARADRCIAHATLALASEPQSVKALFRRSQALVQTKAFDDAVRDLESASQLEPENKLVRSALERARAAQTQLVSKQKQAFAKIF